MGRAVRILLIVFVLGVTLAVVVGALSRSTAKPVIMRPLDPAELAIRDALQRDLKTLAGDIGERNLAHRPNALRAAASFIHQELEKAGLRPTFEEFPARGATSSNVVAELPGRSSSKRVVIVGAHYDTVPGSPGADDNGSGVVTLLALARRFANAGHERGARLRLIAFANEEDPYFGTSAMGSLVHASACRARGDDVVGMISLETIGYYSDAPASQTYPVPALSKLYPSTGNFVAFVGNLASNGLVSRLVASFRKHTDLPVEGAGLPQDLPGVGWSDHWAFWQQGYPALMVTDTAPFRYPEYHTPRDTWERVDYDRLTRAMIGLTGAIEELSH